MLCDVETRRATSLQPCETANMQGWLSVVVGGIKSAATKFANRNNITFGWQPRFHDHIIRQTDEMNRIPEDEGAAAARRDVPRRQVLH